MNARAASPRGRVGVAAAAALVVVAVGAWALTRTYPNYDSYFHLLWGRELLHGVTPSFTAYAAPTEHPLYVLIGGVAGLFGQGGERVLVLFTALCLVALALALARLGRACLGRAPGLAGAALVLSSSAFLLYAAKAYVDLPYLALAAWAAALAVKETGEREEGAGAGAGAALVRAGRRSLLVMGLLALAGLLRPEAWLLAFAYLAGCWRGAAPAQRAALLALALAAPLGWAAVDLAVTGDPLRSFTATSRLAEELSRGRDPSALPGALVSFLASTLRAPVLALGVLGLVVALRRRGWRPLLVPLALLAAGTLAFLISGLLGLSVLPRYLTLPAAALALFAGEALFGWHALPGAHAWRARWRAGAAVALLAGVAGAAALAPSAVRKLRTEVSFARTSHDQLRSLLEDPAVRAARRCGPLVFPTYHGVPEARWLLDAARGAVSAAPAASARAGVRIYVLGEGRALSRFGHAAGVDRSTNEPDQGFREVARRGPFEARARCA